MKNIVFYIESEWVFGRIHYDLSKHLFKHGFNCHVLPWNKAYSVEEMRELEGKTDLFVTIPEGWGRGLKTYGVVPSEKCVIVAHLARDISNLINSHGVDEFEKFHKFGCVSEHLVRSSKELGVKRVPSLAYLGIDYDLFSRKPKEQLRSVGFGGSYSDSEAECHQRNAIIKRGWLARQAAESAGLEFKIACRYHNSFVTMPGFYSNTDALICASTQEGAGMPALEAAVAGNLVITTDVGYVQDRSKDSPIHIVSMGEDAFLKETTELLLEYKHDDAKYKRRCEEIQEHARRYDWSNCIGGWIELLT
jgi:hypothetical protein